MKDTERELLRRLKTDLLNLAREDKLTKLLLDWDTDAACADAPKERIPMSEVYDVLMNAKAYMVDGVVFTDHEPDNPQHAEFVDSFIDTTLSDSEGYEMRVNIPMLGQDPYVHDGTIVLMNDADVEVEFVPLSVMKLPPYETHAV